MSVARSERRPRGELSRVLVIDDEPDIRELIDLTLSRMGLAAACAGTNCNDAPLRRFSVARDQSRQFAGLAGFHPCVDTTNTALGPDCKPRAAAAKH